MTWTAARKCAWRRTKSAATAKSVRIRESAEAIGCRRVTTMIAPPTAMAPKTMKRAGSMGLLFLQQHVDGIDELLPRVLRGSEPSGVHPDRVARARLHAQAAEDAPEHVDVEPHRVLLDLRVGGLPRDDRDAHRGARRGAAEARHAPGGPVGPLHQPVQTPEPGG